MAIGTGTAMALGIGANVVGGMLNARRQNREARRQNAHNQRAQQQFMGMMQQGSSPLEQMGMQMFGGGPGGSGGPMNMMAGPNMQMSPGQMFNSGQDGMMQSMRTDPRARVDETLGGMIDNQGNPYNTSELFRSLGVLDQSNTENAVAATRAGASGLGQRFGSYMANQEGRMRTDANNQAAARNAQIGMQSHGDAQSRMMQALGMASGREQFNQQSQMGLLQTLLGAQQARQGANMQLAQTAFGMGQPVTAPGYGSALQDAGQMIAMSPMMQPRARPGQQQPGQWWRR